ncbi:CPBP family intramembrane glutamic endopeptidase [Synechococcus sp. UW140]|uniref:CPBP family intramembrane glutamic endopeptidase n=1 Tax=Synechococcus sp. UW140 TaxID=368503 RepID=UPI00352BCD55
MPEQPANNAENNELSQLRAESEAGLESSEAPSGDVTRNARTQRAKQRFHPGWTAWLKQPWSWIPTVTLIPILYGLGWLVMQPVAQLLPALPTATRDLMGTGVSFALLLLVLPSWVRIRWGTRHPWRELGLSSSRKGPQRSRALLYGLGLAAALLLLISLISLGGHWGYWLGDLTLPELINAVLLGFGVGFVEELLFRGWLWGELTLLIGPRRAMPIQALIFSLAHTRFNLGLWPMLGLLLGLFLLGMALAMSRRLNQESLWGCIGLHGGLVGGWFALQAGLIQWSPQSPLWLTGPEANPLGGLVGILAMMVVLAFQLTALAKAARP